MRQSRRSKGHKVKSLLQIVNILICYWQQPSFIVCFSAVLMFYLLTLENKSSITVCYVPNIDNHLKIRMENFTSWMTEKTQNAFLSAVLFCMNQQGDSLFLLFKYPLFKKVGKENLNHLKG